MTKLETEDLAAIAKAIGAAAIDALESERRRATERIYGEKAIVAELGISRQQFWKLVKREMLPVDRDPLGLSIRRWDVQRWLEGRRVAVEQAGKRR